MPRIDESEQPTPRTESFIESNWPERNATTRHFAIQQHGVVLTFARQLERELTEALAIDGAHLYCTTCGSCGEEGCCPPSKCWKTRYEELAARSATRAIPEGMVLVPREWLESAEKSISKYWSGDLSELAMHIRGFLAAPRTAVSAIRECQHEAFEGRCVHCDVPFVNGKPDHSEHPAIITDAVAWLVKHCDGTEELVRSPLTDATYMDEGDEAFPLYRVRSVSDSENKT